jgi:hypothetical protein
MERKITRMRPGTLGICSAIQNKYNVDTVPHVFAVDLPKKKPNIFWWIVCIWELIILWL